MADLLEKAADIKKKLVERGEDLAARTGDFLENSIGEQIESRFEAPEITASPETGVWYKMPIEKGKAGDGSEYHIYIKKHRTKKLCVFFSGGGVAWDEKMAAEPVTGGRVVAGRPNYYWNNLRPFTQIMNINIGITESRRRNPFDTWNFAVITYATGDFHVGTDEMTFYDNEGQKEKLRFRGYRNFTESMQKVRELFPKVEKLLIAGDSAGAFATPALSPVILEQYYPEVEDVTVFSDSALLERADWSDTLHNVWHAPQQIADASHSENLTLDWYEALMKKEGKRCRYLYASSVRDYLLSSFQHDILTGEFKTNEEAQEDYFNRLKKMVEKMSALSQPVHFFLYDWKNPMLAGGGTIHTAVRQPQFYLPGPEGMTMAQWLNDAVHGIPGDAGRNLLN